MRLQHIATRRWLHSHLFSSPLTNNQEVRCAVSRGGGPVEVGLLLRSAVALGGGWVDLSVGQITGRLRFLCTASLGQHLDVPLHPF